MTWPTGPPPMPPPAWYDDPEQMWTWRYWDGARWTEHRAPMWVPPARDPMSFSVWFEGAVAFAKIAVRRVGALLVTVWLLLAAVSWILVAGVFESDRGRELRRLLEVDQTTFGPTGSSVTTELTDAEAERAWEVMQDIFWSALPWLIALTVALVVVSAWSVALVARAVAPHVVDPLAADQPPARLGGVVASAMCRVPAVVGSGIVVFATLSAVWAVASLPVVLAVVADGGAVAIVVTAVFVLILVLVVTAWLWARLALASALAGVGGHGLGVRRSWSITHGRFWFVVGRLLVTGLIAGASGAVVNFVTGFGQFLGLAVFLAIVFLLQALAAAVSMIVTICGHLAAVDQLHEPQLAGSSHGDGAA